MKKLYAVIVLCGFAFMTIAQVPNWVWAKRGGGTLINIPNAAATDAFGNVFVTGYFNSAPLTFGSISLTTAGFFDVFLVKYDASGNVLWAKSAGGANMENSYSVATDSSGAVYIAGYFQSDSITFGTTTLINAAPGYQDMFVAKYDSSGTVQWAKRVGGTNDDAAIGVTTVFGSVYIAGNFKSPSFVFGTTTIINTSWADDQIFLARYDTSGNEQWGINTGGLVDNFVNGLTSDRAGNLFVTGTFGTSITFGSTTLTNGTGAHIFLAKYDSTANFSWARSDGGDGGDMPSCLATDTAGNIFMTGWFHGSYTTFGAVTLNNVNVGSSDLFVVKFDPSGTPLWGNRSGGMNNEAALSVSVDQSGNAVITGHYVSPSIVFGTYTLGNAGVYDLFVTKYDVPGNVLWAKRVGAAGADFGQSVAIDGLGNVYVAGDFSSTSIVFGPVTLSNVTPAGDEVFLAKLDITTGMSESFDDDNDGISIYPNPSSGKFTVEAKGILTVHNTLGEKIYSEKLVADKTEIDLSGNAKGIYFIRVDSETGSVTKKIIVN
jgi:hypothetical protein